MRDVTSDIAKIVLMSRLSASIIARGVAAGATNPFHAIASNPGKPLSSIVGRSRSAGQRSRLVTASSFIRPACTTGNSVVGFDITACTSPAAVACTAGGAPLNGI
jgi:hypothetical protein